jgi:hypothetical protein
LEAFSDGVIAIIITIMVLELKVPHGADWAALSKLLPVFLSYVLSFVFVGIYWNNHHHLLHASRRPGVDVVFLEIGEAQQHAIGAHAPDDGIGITCMRPFLDLKALEQVPGQDTDVPALPGISADVVEIIGKRIDILSHIGPS